MHNAANNDAILCLRQSCEAISSDRKALVTSLHQLGYLAQVYILEDALDRRVAFAFRNCAGCGVVATSRDVTHCHITTELLQHIACNLCQRISKCHQIR